MLRSYDPQIGRFLQWDPYDEFSSGYVGMGNDPVNVVDPTGGYGIFTNMMAGVHAAFSAGSTLPMVTVVASKRVVTTASKIGLILSPIVSTASAARQLEGARIINQAFKQSRLQRTLKSIWGGVKAVGPYIARGLGTLVGVLIPIEAGRGSDGSGLRQLNALEQLNTDPSTVNDFLLREIEQRLNSGNALPNDWKFREEIQRRKTARDDFMSSLNKYKTDKYRQNLIDYSYDPGTDFDAHHVFPQKFRKMFEEKLINIDDPKYGTWWQLNDHRSKAKEFNERWESFDVNEHSKEEIIDFGRQLMREFGFNVNF